MVIKGKNNRHKTPNMELVREKDKEALERKKLLEKRKQKMFGSVLECMKATSKR